MLPRCPLGMDVHVDQLTSPDERLRKYQPYTYHMFARVNLTELRSAYGLADDAFFYSINFEGQESPQVAFQIIFCPLNGNLCSPFSNKIRTTTRRLEFIQPQGHIMNEYEPDQDDKESRQMLRRRLQVKVKEVGQNLTKHNGPEYVGPVRTLVVPQMLIPVNASAGQTVFDFHIDMDLGFPYSGSYLPLATLQFFLDNGTLPRSTLPARDNETLIKFDIANLLHQRTQTFYDPIEINTVSDGIAILTYVLVALAVLAQILLLGYIIYYRKEGVMKLSQVGFLIVLLFAGIMACCCSVLFNPVSDLSCYLAGPMVFIPLQLMLAIVYGRLRRIFVILAPLMEWHNPHTHYQTKQGLKTWKKAFMASSGTSTTTVSSSLAHSEISHEETSERTQVQQKRWIRWPKATRRPKAIRRTYSAVQLWRLIGLVVTPVIVLSTLR